MTDDTICPRYETAMSILGKKWTGLLLLILLEGPKRFSELRRSIPGLSDRLLSQRLKDLEYMRIVNRIVTHSTPVVIHYELTEKGRDLEPAITAIQAWAEEWC